MAVRSCGLSLVAIALAVSSVSHGLAEGRGCQGPPGPRQSEAAGAGPPLGAEDGGALDEAAGAGGGDAGCTAADVSVHLLQAAPHGVQGGWQADWASLGGSLQGSSSGPPRLRFLHIPRTGGNSIEMANMLLPPGHEAFISLFHDTVSCLEATKYQGISLAEVFNATHSDLLRYTALMISNPCYHFVSIGNAVSKSMCLDYHYPPSYSTLLQAYYQQGPTFCSVREPSERLLSAFMVQRNAVDLKAMNVDCTVPAFDAAITRLIEEHIPKDPFGATCFYVHQRDFAASCQHIIHTEALGEEFAALMRSYGQNVTLPPYRVGDDWTETCNIKVANLSHSTRQLLYEFLKEDYEYLGYPPPL